jgi:hypothetical protein
MVEVFISDIQNTVQAKLISTAILNGYNELKITVDLNERHLAFPCGHSIVRVEGDNINADKILAIVRNEGFNCEILEDKICTPTGKS